MTIRRLRTLVAIADHKTFSAAAGIVHVSHAAVSQQMKALEADLGLTLFRRAGRSPDLTPVAHQLVAKARKVIAEYDALVPSVLGAPDVTGELRIGALRTTLTGLTPQALAGLTAQHPDLALHIRPGLTSALIADLQRGALDAALITRPHMLAEGLMFRALASEHMHLIVSPQESGTDPIHLLQSRPYIRFDRTAVVGTLIENWITANALHVRETMELDSLEAIASMVHANLGVSIVPRAQVPTPEHGAVQWIPLGADAPARTLGLAYARDHLKLRAVEALYDAFEAVLAREKDALG